MTWTAPMTAIAGSVYTAAQFNTFVRDNFLETAPAKATTTGGYFVTSNTNQISERIPTSDDVLSSETTSNTAFTDLATAGPSVTATTGDRALVAISARVQNNTVGQSAYASMEISGATTLAANDNLAVGLSAAAANQLMIASHVSVVGVIPGSNTFTMKYRSTSGAATATFANRRIAVFPL